jgi:thioredoxin reductase (NADPH)
MNFNLTGVSTGNEAAEEPQHVKILVLGSGPAGWSAALYAARAEMSPLVLTGLELGGQAALTHTIENYPGFPEGVGGSELGELFQKQAERFGAQVQFDRANEVDLSERPFTVKTDSGNVFKAEALVIATGASPNHLQVPGEVELTGRGVSYCGTCDGWFFREKRVVVVGGGDSALEEALFLTRYASSVTIVHRRDTLRAGAILQSRAKANPKVKFIWNSVITSVVGKEAVTGVMLKNVQSGEESLFATDGVFIFIGHTPNTQMFESQMEMEPGGYIHTDKKMQTSVPGVYAAGEATDSVFKQVVVSAGMGAGAAMQAIKFLEENEN